MRKTNATLGGGQERWKSRTRTSKWRRLVLLQYPYSADSAHARTLEPLPDSDFSFAARSCAHALTLRRTGVYTGLCFTMSQSSINLSSNSEHAPNGGTHHASVDGVLAPSAHSPAVHIRVVGACGTACLRRVPVRISPEGPDVAHVALNKAVFLKWSPR